MSVDELKNDLFDRAWNNECDGLCEEHRGECKVVSVRACKVDWWFSYCDVAIAEDTRRGLIVTVHNLAKMSRVEDTRTPDQRAKDELSHNLQKPYNVDDR
jgi:hypothetical protein